MKLTAIALRTPARGILSAIEISGQPSRFGKVGTGSQCEMDMKNPENEVIETERRLAAAYQECKVADFELLVLDSCVVADEGRIRTKPREAKYVARGSEQHQGFDRL